MCQKPSTMTFRFRKDNPLSVTSRPKQEGVRIASTIYEDARTSGNWFVISAMGREAGHLAFGIGAACHLPMIIIPEMFNKTRFPLTRSPG